MYATYEVLSNKIVLDYTSSKGEWMGGEAVHLTAMNDEGRSFAEIADWIEANVPVTE